MCKRDLILRALLLPILATAGCPPQAGQPTGPALYQQLQAQDPSARIQATLDAVKQGDQQAVPYIVENLGSQDTDVRLFSSIALKKLTGQTMGFEPYAPDTDREQAIARWRQWLKGGRSSASTQPTQPAASAPSSTSSPASRGSL